MSKRVTIKTSIQFTPGTKKVYTRTRVNEKTGEIILTKAVTNSSGVQRTKEKRVASGTGLSISNGTATTGVSISEKVTPVTDASITGTSTADTSIIDTEKE